MKEIKRLIYMTRIEGGYLKQIYDTKGKFHYKEENIDKMG